MKNYQFIINACEAERSNGMFVFMPMSIVYREEFNGTLAQAFDRVKAVRDELSTKQYENGKGVFINAYLARGQRKPAGYDKNRNMLSANWIAV